MDSKGNELSPFGNKQPAPERTCLICGCTDSKACEGGCSWVLPEICSKCVTDKVPECIDLILVYIKELERDNNIDVSTPAEALCKFARKVEKALRQ